MEHCISKIAEIVSLAECDRRSVLQLGYNLGRLSELTGQGRDVFWDPWKDAVATWDLEKLGHLAGDLRQRVSALERSTDPLESR